MTVAVLLQIIALAYLQGMHGCSFYFHNVLSCQMLILIVGDQISISFRMGQLFDTRWEILD
jgi:hypothetical protein